MFFKSCVKFKIYKIVYTERKKIYQSQALLFKVADNM